MEKINGKKHIFVIAIILLYSFVLIVPQIFYRGMVIGSDSLFHFNRFYETAMQIKEGNFEYFISLYSFQQSARIVSAFYGPLFAYFHGSLVLLGKSWYGYQLLANFTLYVLAGFSMHGFLRKWRLQIQVALPIALIFLSTYSIQYWVCRQGFTSWGAALMPICLCPLYDLLIDRKIKSLKLALAMIVMVQVHLFSALLLMLIYFPSFLYAFAKTANRSVLLRNLIFSVGLFFLCTLNIWISLFDLYTNNQILQPFVNKTIYNNTITGNSYYWLINPLVLVGILPFLLIQLKKWKTFDSSLKLLFGLLGFFLILTTNLIPWRFLIENGNKFAEFVQFPFRFFVPVTVLALLLFGRLINAKKNRSLLVFLVCISLIQTLILSIETVKPWLEHDFTYGGSPMVLADVPPPNIKEAFFSEDLSEALTLVQKATPDYLPITKSPVSDSYGLYREKIIENQDFSKKVLQNKLEISWNATEENWVELPIVKYHGTHIVSDGKEVSEEDYRLGELGTIIFKQRAGVNKLMISYQPTLF